MAGKGFAREREEAITETITALKGAGAKILGKDRVDKLDEKELHTYLATEGNYNATYGQVMVDMGQLAVFINEVADWAEFLFDKYGASVKNPKRFFNEILAVGIASLGIAQSHISAAKLSRDVAPISSGTYTVLQSIIVTTSPEIQQMMEHPDVTRHFDGAMSVLPELQEAKDAKAREGD